MAVGDNSTTTTSANDLLVTVLNQSVVEERRPLMVPYADLHTRSNPVGKGRVVQHAIQDDPGAASAATEATDLANTQLTTSSNTVTAVEQAIMATVTDVLDVTAVIAAIPHFSGVIARSLSERVNDIFCGLYDDFATTTGVSGADLTIAQFLAAAAALAGRDVPGPYQGVLNVQQLYDLRAGSGGILPSIGYQATAGFGNDFLASGQFNQNIMDSVQRSAGPYQIGDVRFWVTSSTVTANNGADVTGALFNKDAIAYHELWGQRVEPQRDASLRAWELIASANIGAAEIVDLCGQTLITDAP